MRSVYPIALILSVFAASASADSLPITFSPSYSITNNKAGDVAIGMKQIRMTMSPSLDSYNNNAVIPGHVDFTFRNARQADGTFQQSSITDIWFDDGKLTEGIFDGVLDTSPYNPKIISSYGVKFERWATPIDPPGGQTVTPTYNVTFSADAKTPQPKNGLDHPDEWLTFRWTLQNGLTYEDAVHAMVMGEIRIAVKMQDYASGGSETFIMMPSPVAVSGGASLLLLSAFVGRRNSGNGLRGVETASRSRLGRCADSTG